MRLAKTCLVAFGISAVSLAVDCGPLRPAVQSEDYTSSMLSQYGHNSAARCYVDSIRAERKKVIDDFRAQIMEKGKRLHGAEKAKLAEESGKLAAVSKLVDDFQPTVLAYVPRMEAALQGVMQEYPQKASLYIVYLKETAEHGAQDTVETLPERAKDLDARLRTQRNATADLVLGVHRLLGQWAHEEETFFEDLAPYQGFLKDKNIVVAPPFRDAIAALRTWTAAIETHDQQLQARSQELASQLRQRLQVLTTSGIEATGLASAAQAASLQASATFLDTMSARIAAAWSAPVAEKGLLEADYRRKSELYAMKDVCVTHAPAWMTAGCTAFQREAPRLKIYFSRTLRRNLEAALATWREQKKPDPVGQLERLASAVTREDWLSATREHDAFVSREVSR